MRTSFIGVCALLISFAIILTIVDVSHTSGQPGGISLVPIGEVESIATTASTECYSYADTLDAPSTSSPKAGFMAKRARVEYLNTIFGDPASGMIPASAEARARKYARTLPTVASVMGRSRPQSLLNWEFAGPNNIGGRTRALAVDITDANTLIAAGVSGGIYKSTNKGESWHMVTEANQITNFTSIAQDPREGFTNTWYAVSGEMRSSAGILLGTRLHQVEGDALYVSTDNGESWERGSINAGNNTGNIDNLFHFTTKIVVHPQTGTLFTANTEMGIFRSTNGGKTFELVLGEPFTHYRNDVIVTGNGVVVAALSDGLTASLTEDGVDPMYWKNGIYFSYDDGQTWKSFTADDFPEESWRTVLASAPSNPNRVYAFTLDTPRERLGTRYDLLRFYAYDLADSTIDDRTENLPDYDMIVLNNIHTQASYNMCLYVHPEDENLVLLGATSLFRSFDAFATYPADSNQTIIGGYIASLHETRALGTHPDFHVLAADPSNPDAVWTGNDGGINYIPDITDTTFDGTIEQYMKNGGYFVTQFYHITQPQQKGRPEIIGGTQDNGTLYFSGPADEAEDITSADGGHSHFGVRNIIASRQNGMLLRLFPNIDGSYKFSLDTDFITPFIDNAYFIHPSLVEPLREEVIFYPEMGEMLRNRNAQFENTGWNSDLPHYNDWQKVPELTLSNGARYTALGMARQNSSDRLYLGAYLEDSRPVIVRVENASDDSVQAALLLDENWPLGGFIHNIAVHPRNPDEFAVVMSNFNINGLWYSADGGESFTSIEGNLLGSDNEMGPSIRSMLFQPTPDGTLYLVATSAGLYSTNELVGPETVWALEAPETIGRAIGYWLDGRTSDGRIVFGTHGRGAFIAYTKPFGQADLSILSESLALEVIPGDTAAVEFVIANEGDDVLYYGSGRWYRGDVFVPVDMPGGFSVEKLRGVLLPGENDSLTVTVTPSSDAKSDTVYTGYLLMHSAYEVAGLPLSVRVLDPVMSASEHKNALPTEYALRKNYPNPFNPSTTISFDLPEAGSVRLEVYTIGGELVDEIVNSEMAAGTHSLQWQAVGLSSGIYLYRIASGGFVQTKKMMYLK